MNFNWVGVSGQRTTKLSNFSLKQSACIASDTASGVAMERYSHPVGKQEARKNRDAILDELPLGSLAAQMHMEVVEENDTALVLTAAILRKCPENDEALYWKAFVENGVFGREFDRMTEEWTSSDPRLLYQMQYYALTDEMRFALALRAAEMHYGAAMVVAGFYHEHGLGTDCDIDQAAIWYSKAAEAGEPGAMFRMSKLLGEEAPPIDEQTGLLDMDVGATREWFQDQGVSESNFFVFGRFATIYAAVHGELGSVGKAFVGPRMICKDDPAKLVFYNRVLNSLFDLGVLDRSVLPDDDQWFETTRDMYACVIREERFRASALAWMYFAPQLPWKLGKDLTRVIGRLIYAARIASFEDFHVDQERALNDQGASPGITGMCVVF